jgi:hypothetical protein
MDAWWDWLRDPENREVLYLIGGALAALTAAGWAMVKFVLGATKAGGGGASVRASKGSIASGRDTTIGGDFGQRDPPPPRRPVRRRRD